MSIPPPYVLVFRNAYKDTFYFVRLGDSWPHNLERRLIEATTPDRIRARVFDTLPEALETLVVAGQPPGWEAEAVC